MLPNTPAEETSTNNGDRPSWHAALEESWEPYKCTVCNKGFQKMSKLTAHMKIHRYLSTTYVSHIKQKLQKCPVDFRIKNSTKRLIDSSKKIARCIFCGIKLM